MAKKPAGFYSKGKVKSKDAVDIANARKSLTSVKGIAGIIGGAILEGIGGPKARGAKAVGKMSAKVARAVANEAAGKGAKAPYGIYRKPSTSKRPRLRDTDNTPRKTTVRQQVGPKTKSGKFAEKKYQPKTNTQPPARTKVEKPKAELPAVTKVGGRVIAINKRSANPKIRKRQEAQLRIANREFSAERQRQAKLAVRRGSKSGTEAESIRPSQPTIESRLASGAEKLDITSRNASKPPQTSTAEWRKYAQQMRDSNAKTPNVTTSQINRGRARALMPNAERRAIDIKATQNRAIAKAKARGMSDAQISQMIAKARREAANIAKKAGK